MKLPQGSSSEKIAVVFSGGIGLGAYQAGVYEALHNDGGFHPVHFAGSSVGALNCALIAGSPPEARLSRLREFWAERAIHFPFSFHSGPLRHLQNWMSVVHARLLGVRGHFRPFWALNPGGEFSGLYSLRPMRDTLCRLIDFSRLNASETHVSIATTDIESGELVMFDNRSDRIEVDHLIASCGYLPEFAPTLIGDRLLGDGGLSANAPIEAVIRDPEHLELILVADLFSREGGKPTTLESALARKSDLLLANQTHVRLEAFRHEELKRRAAGAGIQRRIVFLSYRAGPDEAGAEKPFDYSHDTICDRWRAGTDDFTEAVRRLAEPSNDPILAIRRG